MRARHVLLLLPLVGQPLQTRLQLSLPSTALEQGVEPLLDLPGVHLLLHQPGVQADHTWETHIGPTKQYEAPKSVAPGLLGKVEEVGKLFLQR